MREVAPDVRAVHVHIVEITDPQWGDYLRFRDALRADEGLRAAYTALKTRLMEAHAGDRRAYTAGKHAFIRDILAVP